MIRTGRALRTLPALAALAGLALVARADVRPLTLFQRTGRTPWILYGEIGGADKRFVEVKVLEVMKGTYAQPTFRIIYKLENFLRQDWQEKMEFKAGERDIFFLKRYETDRRDGKLEDWMKAEDLFAPTFGAQAKFNVPDEGGGAYLEAVREFVRVGAIEDPVARTTALLAFLGSANPHVLQAGLERAIEERLAGPSDVPLLLRLSDSPRDPVRLDALQVIRIVAEDLRASKGKLPDHDDVVASLKGKAIGDGGDLYRAEAVKAIALLSGEEERAFLARLSKEDRSQLVRYEAERSLVGLGAN